MEECSANCLVDVTGQGFCSGNACIQQVAMCDGNLATVCNAEGTGPVPFQNEHDCAENDQACRALSAHDCSEENQVCRDGKCIDARTCTPGERLCLDEQVYLCGADGMGVTLFHACERGTACQESSASCQPVPQACEPGERFCRDDNVYRCRESGSGASLVEACSAEMPCHSSFQPYSYVDENQYRPGGADCLRPFEGVPCTPGRSYCLNDYVTAKCNESGTSSSLSGNCAGDGFQCVEGGCGHGCPAVCRGNELFVCSYGEYPTSGIDCGNAAVCRDDSLRAGCVPIICTAGALSCGRLGTGVYRCSEQGLDRVIEERCALGTLCDAMGGDVGCKKLGCSAGSNACFANQVGTCAEDGLSLGSLTTDCAVNGQVCDGDGSCADSVIDTMGSDEQSLTGSSYFVGDTEFVGNAVCVDSRRALTELQVELSLLEPAVLEWEVFEILPDGLNAIATVSTQPRPGDGFFSSGPLAVSLEVGSCYLLAVEGMPFTTRLYYQGEPIERPVSFGHAVGGALQPAAYAVFPDQLYRMRVTTELP